jgi:hypothetical protein
MFKIADVSEFQQVIDWQKYGAENPVVIIRAHNGFRADRYFTGNQINARAFVKGAIGYYQYLPATVDAIQAAKDFAATIGNIRPNEFVILDIEEGSGNQDSRRVVWLQAINYHTEWTYSGMIFARNHLPGVKIDWLAAYQYGEPTDAHTLWQFTDKQAFAGITFPCDASQFDGDLNAFLKLIGSPQPTSSATPLLVAQIQGALHITADGKWGDITDAVASTVIRKLKTNIRALQGYVGTKEDGIWGPNSDAAWLETIKRLQTLVGTKPDGVWGPISQAAWDKVRANNYKKY